MLVKFWGTRGSIPVPGNTTLKYGGNTPCVEIKADHERIIILDAGTGIRSLGKYLTANNNNEEIHIFITHYHWDHIQGIPFFLPLYEENRKITFYGLASQGMKIEKLLSMQMFPSYFPVAIEELKAQINFKNIITGNILNLNGINIETLDTFHSSPTLAFKISCNNKSVVYMTDNEIHSNEPPEKLLSGNWDDRTRKMIEFCRGSSCLIHDTMYDESLIRDKKGWGHSSNISLAYFSIAAEIKNLVLFHYNPDFSDNKIAEILEETKTILSGKNVNIECFAATEGMEISF